jgi:hypothetical protein
MVKVDHSDTTRRRFLATAAMASAATATVTPVLAADSANDGRLIELGEKIFEHYKIIKELEERAASLLEVCLNETKNLLDACCTGKCTLTKKEQSAIVSAMPECIEHTRLVHLQWEREATISKMVDEMWSIPSKTPEGRQAKFLVLLNRMTKEDWTSTDARADYPILLARNFMIEMIGGAPAINLRNQFAAA